MRLYLTLLALSLCLTSTTRAALVLNVNAQAQTMEWVSGQTTFTAAADLGFLFGSGTGSIIRFFDPEPQRTGDFDNASGMIVEIVTNVSETAIVGIHLIVG